MACGSGSCNWQEAAEKVIRELGPKHLVLIGSCCNVKSLVQVAPEVTILGRTVDKLIGLPPTPGLNLIATLEPFSSLSLDSADVVYWCENTDLSKSDLEKISNILKVGGHLVMSVRYYLGNHQSSDLEGLEPGVAYDKWQEVLIDAGLSEPVVHQPKLLAQEFDLEGEPVFSVHEGLISVQKEAI